MIRATQAQTRTLSFVLDGLRAAGSSIEGLSQDPDDDSIIVESSTGTVQVIDRTGNGAPRSNGTVIRKRGIVGVGVKS